MPFHSKWNVLQKCANLNKSANKTHQFSASSLLHSSTQLLRCSLKDCHTAQISRAFKFPGYLPSKIAAHLLCSGNLFSSAVRRIYWTRFPVLLTQFSDPESGMGSWSPCKPPSRMKCKEPSVFIAQPGYWPKASHLTWPWLCDQCSLGSQLP